MSPQRVPAIAAAVLLLCGTLAAQARADGDPASDVLATQRLFLPQDAGVPPAERQQLSTLLEAARRSGYPIRVALIASPGDLGSVTELWHQPQNYARFLGQELALVYRGPLLVVMPNGYGAYHLRAASLPATAAGGRLGPATVDAVRRLATAAGVKLAVGAAVAQGASKAATLLPWIVFAIGLLAIASAWIASLRVRPPRLSRGRLASH